MLISLKYTPNLANGPVDRKSSLGQVMSTGHIYLHHQVIIDLDY